MNPLLLIGFDLVVSAVLILLSMYLIWTRVQSRLEALGGKTSDSGIPATPDKGGAKRPRPPEDVPGDQTFENIPQQAAVLRRKGCSLEEISQRLRVPTREVEMVLAISEMTRNEAPGAGMSAPFGLDPKTAHPA